MTLLLTIVTAWCATLGPWRAYEVYQPRIERHFVIHTHAQPLKYNHDSSVAWFQDRWFCLWNANEPPAEGKPGQRNVVSTSRDGKTWSSPAPVFSSPEHSANPIPCPRGTQWQPNLIVVEGELWALWDQNSKDEHAGTYLSRLTRPDGKWTNRLLQWDGNTRPLVEGKRFRLFPTQNPYRLRSGRVLVPVTMIGPPADDAPEDVDSWWATEKRNSVIYSDDVGKTWRVSPGAIQPGRSWAQWEPTVWERPDGTVMMFARNNDRRVPAKGGPKPHETLLCSRSTDGGATWTPHQTVPIETVVSRMHVLPCGGDRFVMAHNDWPRHQFVRDRKNLALFFNRGGDMDFVAGPGLTGREPVVAYPQLWIKDNAALVSYSQGGAYRSIKVVHVSPLPDPKRYYLFPRDNLPPSPQPIREGRTLRFDANQRLATRKPVDVGQDGFSAAAWVRPERGGALIDTRSSGPTGGFVWGLSTAELKPFLYIYTEANNITSSLTLRRNEWNYVGVTVDNETGIVWFFVNGRRHGIVYVAPAPKPLRGSTGHIGYKRFESSAVVGLTGDLRAMEIYDARLDRPEHAWLQNRLADELSLPRIDDARAPKAEPMIHLDAADAGSLERGFVLPRENPHGSVTVTTVEDQKALRFAGASSAGMDLDVNRRGRGDRVEVEFRFRIESGDRHVLCTVGDAVQPARLVHEKGQLRLEAANQRRRCGGAKRGAWMRVRIETADDHTSVRIGDGKSEEVQHKPKATWVYLGQGYRQEKASAKDVFAVSIPSVRSRVHAN